MTRPAPSKTRASLLATVLLALSLALPQTVSAACYTVNVTYYNRNTTVGTSCLHHYQHGNVYASAYSKVKRLARPPGYPAYCSQAGTRITATGWVNGAEVKSTLSWKQSTVNWANMIYSRTYAYQGSAAYFSEDNSPWC